MNQGEMLVKLLEGGIVGLQGNIDVLTNLHDDSEDRIAGFDDGKICGLSGGIGVIRACLRLYATYLKGEMPQEMIDRLLFNANDDYKLTEEQAKAAVEEIKRMIMEKRNAN